MPLTRVKVHARKPDGIRRAGRHWPSDTVECDVDDGMLELIESEPYLDVCRWQDKRWVRSSQALAAPEKSAPTLGDALATQNEHVKRLRAVNVDLKNELDRVRADLAKANEEIELLGKRNGELEALTEAATKPSKSKG